MASLISGLAKFWSGPILVREPPLCVYTDRQHGELNKALAYTWNVLSVRFFSHLVTWYSLHLVSGEPELVRGRPHSGFTCIHDDPSSPQSFEAWMFIDRTTRGGTRSELRITRTTKRRISLTVNSIAEVSPIWKEGRAHRVGGATIVCVV